MRPLEPDLEVQRDVHETDEDGDLDQGPMTAARRPVVDPEGRDRDGDGELEVVGRRVKESVATCSYGAPILFDMKNDTKNITTK